MALERKEAKAECPCNEGSVSKGTAISLGNMATVEGAGDRCQNPKCDKDPNSVFLYVHCDLGQEADRVV